MVHALPMRGHSLDSVLVAQVLIFIKRCLLATFFVGLGGCSSGSSAMLQTARTMYGHNAVVAPQLNPNYRYLKTRVNGRLVFLVLGYIDRHDDHPVEVWYSASGEIIKLQDGHIIGTSGLSADWQHVRMPSVPSWPASHRDTFKDRTSEPHFLRERDMMPGYRFGIVDQIARHSIAPPSDSAISGTAPRSLDWYEEVSVSRPQASSLPPARFGVSYRSGAPRVVYSEQCISSDLCMSFEQWPPLAPSPVTPANGS
jgi:hypothetical protein